MGPIRISWLERLAAFAVALACLTVLLIGASLHPDPAGVGTHQQLGLPACAWRQRYGIPCPACGFTTAFSYYSHGNWIASLYVQPMGFVLAMLAAMMVWVGFYIAATGRPVHRLVASYWTQWTVIWLLGLFLAAWAYKIMLTLTHHDGWRGF